MVLSMLHFLCIRSGPCDYGIGSAPISNRFLYVLPVQNVLAITVVHTQRNAVIQHDGINSVLLSPIVAPLTACQTLALAALALSFPW